jgi:CHAT domain-containing protein
MRSLEDHISPQELASLPESPEILASGGTEQQQLSQHLGQCEACHNLAKTHWGLRGLRTVASSTNSGGACPQETDWLDFAAGLRSGQSAILLAHAANCSVCAIALREAMEFIQSDQFDARSGATESIEGLASATPEWQRRVAMQMMMESGVSPTVKSTREGPASSAPKLGIIHRLRLQPAWITFPATAIVLCAIVLTGVAIWRDAHPSDARLLALAYNKQRTLALRIPGADPAPFASGIRGPATGLSDPTELLELQLRAQHHLEQTPNSPYWHQILGEIQLLQQDGIAARRNFEIAQTTDETLPNLKFDLAAAWFEIGDKTGSAEAYGEAAELYSRLLQEKPTDPALLYYNRALCWERQNLNDNALNDLRAALPLERSAAWRKVIEAEIVRLSSRSATISTDGYEASLEEVTEKLLPLWTTSPVARAKIQQTAALGLHHHDRWLQDWIAANHTPTAIEGDRHLAAAVVASTAGEAEASLIEANRATEFYQKANQRPGLLRAELAETYSLQRLGRTDQCLRQVAGLTNAPLIANYSWMQTRTLEVQADCREMSGDFYAQQRSLERAISLSTNADLPLLHIRTIGEQTELAQSKGLNLITWQMTSDALHRCHVIRCPAINEYTFMYLLVKSAQSLKLPHVAAEVMRVATNLAGQTGNATTLAYALETLGTLTGRIGDYAASTEAFRQASTAAYSGRKGAAAAIYQADWQTDRAEILSRQGMHSAALDLLRQNGPLILASGYLPGRLHYLRQLALTQLSSGHYDDALATSWKAVYEAERSLPSLHSSSEKEHWQRANETAYAELVKTYLRRGEDTHALQAWERFRTAPYRSHPGAGIVEDDSISPSLTDTRVLVLARIDDVYVGWVVSPSPLRSVQMINLGAADPIQRAATTFYRLCADPNSSLTDIRAVGSHLYALILQPFREQIGTSNHLWIESDSSLTMLPFAALTLPDGAWLNTLFEITFVPAWWTLHPAITLAETAITPAMHLVAVSGFNDSQTADSEIPVLAHLFQSATVLQGSRVNAHAVLQYLQSAEVFHFSGHASTAFSSQALLSPVDGFTPEAISSIHVHHYSLGVLAACNTTATDPDQVEKLPDLRNALLFSGARSVVASDWDVDDASTQTLMLTFYKQLMLGLSPTQSLRFSQKYVRSSNAWQHPYYWAAFEVFGN